MEIGGSEGHVAQNRHAEEILVLRLLGEVGQTEGRLLVIRRGSGGAEVSKGIDVLEARAAEGGTGVALGAARGQEGLVTRLLRGSQRILVALEVKVKGAVRCHEGLLIGRDRIGNRVARDALVRVHQGKQTHQLGILLQLGSDESPILRGLVAHLDGVEGRAARLLLEIGRATVPELADILLRVEDRGCVHTAELRLAVRTGHALRLSKVIRTALREVVAGSASHLVRGGEASVIEEQVAQADLRGLRLVSRGRGGNQRGDVILGHLAAEDAAQQAHIRGQERGAPVHGGVRLGRHAARAEHMVHLQQVRVGGAHERIRHHRVGALSVGDVLLQQAEGEEIDDGRVGGIGTVAGGALVLQNLVGQIFGLSIGKGGHDLLRDQLLPAHGVQSEGTDTDDNAATEGYGNEG